MAETVTDDLNLDDVFEAEAPKTEPASEQEQTGQPRDESGRFAPKQEAKPEPKAEAPEVEDKAEPEAAPRHVPLKELQTERQKRQEEARLRAEAEARAAVYERQVQAFLSQRQPAAPQQQAQPPDPYTDPEGFTRFHVSRAQAQMEERLLHISESNARRAYGNELVDECLQMARAAGDPSYFSRFPDPWAAMVEWGKKQKALAKIGPDPDAYEKQIEERARAQAIADLKAGKIKLDGRPVQQQRFPGTLADQTSASVAQTAHMSDDAMMGSIFAR